MPWNLCRFFRIKFSISLFKRSSIKTGPRVPVPLDVILPIIVIDRGIRDLVDSGLARGDDAHGAAVGVEQSGGNRQLGEVEPVELGHAQGLRRVPRIVELLDVGVDCAGVVPEGDVVVCFGHPCFGDAVERVGVDEDDTVPWMDVSGSRQIRKR